MLLIWRSRTLRIFVEEKKNLSDLNAQYCQLYCGVLDAAKGQLTSRFSEILEPKFVSLLKFGTFKYYPEHFPDVAYES